MCSSRIPSLRPKFSLPIPTCRHCSWPNYRKAIRITPLSSVAQSFFNPLLDKNSIAAGSGPDSDAATQDTGRRSVAAAPTEPDRSIYPTRTTFPIAAEGQATAVDASAPSLRDPLYSSSDLQTQISRSLLAKETHEMSAILETALENKLAIARIPHAIFAQALLRLDASDRSLPSRDIYRARIPRHYWHLRILHRQHLQDFVRLRRLVRSLWQQRASSSDKLTVKEYRGLLKCMRDTCDAQGATTLMEEMLSGRLTPDIHCFNYYFEAICWADAWHPDERRLLRNNPWTRYVKNCNSQTQSAENGQLQSHMIGDRGVKKEILDKFALMAQKGITPDLTSHGHLITALAREEDLDGVKSIFKKLWGFDPADLNDSEKEQELLNEVPLSTPPTIDFLYILVHAFLINNDFLTSVKMIDFFKNKYSLHIGVRVWEEVMEHAYVLSSKRSKKRRLEGMDLGRLPRRTVDHLWTVLTSEPYACVPTLPMYDLMARSHFKNENPWALLECVLAGAQLHHSNVREYRRLMDERDEDPRITPSKLEEWRNNVHVSNVFLRKWLVKVLSLRRPFYPNARAVIWQRKLIPDIVDYFWQYRSGRGVGYKIQSGKILLESLGEFG